MKNKTTIDPLFYSRLETAYRLKVSATLFDEMRASGHFGVKPLRAGKKLLFPIDEVENYLTASTEAGRFLTFDDWQARKLRAAQ